MTIPAGSQSASILLTPILDSQTEADETVILKLEPSTNYQLGVSTQATAILQDASTAALPSLSLTSTKTELLEGSDTSLKLVLTRQTADLSQALAVYIQTDSWK